MAELEYDDIYRALSVPESKASLSRRRFIQAALACGGAAVAAPYINMASAFAAAPVGRNEGILVFVFMGGGNDSLNMVVPTGDSAYYDKRGTLAIKQSDALALDGVTGLHPNLRGLKQRYDSGQVAVVRGVAVPSPDLSHFTSMATWMKGSASTGAVSSGWLGRYLDGLDLDPLRAIRVGTSVPLHLVGATTQASAVPASSGSLFGANRSNASDARMFDAVRLFAEGSTSLGYWGDS